jgi:hypothetical protein
MKLMAKELWRPVMEIGDGKIYAVSSRGRVRNLVYGSICQPNVDVNGNLRLRSHVGGKNTSVALHCLVARYFLSGKPNYPVVFKDGNKLHCSVSNLEWAKGNKKVIRYRKLTDADVRYIRRHWPRMALQQLAARFQVHKDTIWQATKRKTFNGPRWEPKKRIFSGRPKVEAK